MTTTETWGAGSGCLVSAFNNPPAKHACRVTNDNGARGHVSNHHTPHSHQRAIPYDGALNDVTSSADITARPDAYTAGQAGGARNYGIIPYDSVMVYNHVGENGDMTANPDAGRYCHVREHQGARADLDSPGEVSAGMNQSQKAILRDGRDQVRTASKVGGAAERVHKPSGRILQRRAQGTKDREAPDLGSPLPFIVIEEALGAITQTVSRELGKPVENVSSGACRP
jgi:hypothetical protein